MRKKEVSTDWRDAIKTKKIKKAYIQRTILRLIVTTAVSFIGVLFLITCILNLKDTSDKDLVYLTVVGGFTLVAVFVTVIGASGVVDSLDDLAAIGKIHPKD